VEGVEAGNSLSVEVGERRSEEGVKEVVSIGLPGRVAEEWSRCPVRHRRPNSELEIPQRRGCVDRVVRMKGKDDTERAVNLARLVRFAARRCKPGTIYARTKQSELSSGRVRNGDPPDDPREGLKG
jgi:hypothetical protein